MVDGPTVLTNEGIGGPTKTMYCTSFYPKIGPLDTDHHHVLFPLGEETHHDVEQRIANNIA